MWGWIRRRVFGISPEEATFGRRGFHAVCSEARRRLERAGKTFIHGYNTGLECGEPEILAPRLRSRDPIWQGFAFEGAAMALMLLDVVTPWRRNRFPSFLGGPGRSHVYMVHVGAGWALARLRRDVNQAIAQFDPLLRWLVVDGYGFHQGFFFPDRYVRRQEVPDSLVGYSRRAFDQGIGRCLWFVYGADHPAIAESVASFDDGRQADLWSGIGLACAYAGGTDQDGLEALRVAAKNFQPELAQGAAFAAKARQRASIEVPNTELACRVLCDSSAEQAARLTDEALKDLPADAAEPSFEIWRKRLQREYVQEVGQGSGQMPALSRE